jgi:hypothetical protein
VEGTAPTGAPSAALKSVSIIGILVIVAGAILSIAGTTTWFTVRSQLQTERITVSENAARFAGQTVAGPFTAYAQAEAIDKSALQATGGKTFAELPREDPNRQTVMTASFLRASLFTSVVAFGVAAMAAGLGVVFILVGVALLKIGKLQV